ncbi:hypothetical protein HK097_001334 [Rhizophlyctis rosea]|uniref:DUF7605 domain-containing protein n=1 Tax=Rhizophlyctis rosea TaxID=64517 RepID=A0AAD5SGY5_9FUNG|nr:hypothetical protein HK097_001334 [Rhizophlyctis rosea]
MSAGSLLRQQSVGFDWGSRATPRIDVTPLSDGSEQLKQSTGALIEEPSPSKYVDIRISQPIQTQSWGATLHPSSDGHVPDSIVGDDEERSSDVQMDEKEDDLNGLVLPSSPSLIFDRVAPGSPVNGSDDHIADFRSPTLSAASFESEEMVIDEGNQSDHSDAVSIDPPESIELSFDADDIELQQIEGDTIVHNEIFVKQEDATTEPPQSTFPSDGLTGDSHAIENHYVKREDSALSDSDQLDEEEISFDDDVILVDSDDDGDDVGHYDSYNVEGLLVKQESGDLPVKEEPEDVADGHVPDGLDDDNGGGHEFADVDMEEEVLLEHEEDREEFSPQSSDEHLLIVKTEHEDIPHLRDEHIEEGPFTHDKNDTLALEPESDPAEPEEEEQPCVDGEQLTARIDAAIKAATDILQSLKGCLEATNVGASEKRKSDWWERIRQLESIKTSARTVVAVVGNTGGGKSSVINALLDHENLVPTNNDDYEADIEFLTRDDWRTELENLKKDIGVGPVKMKKAEQTDEEKVAWAKIHAVYPMLLPHEIIKSDVESLLTTGICKDVLGTVKHIVEKESEDFLKRIIQYVDAKPKTTRKQRAKVEQEFWPLVRVVRIRVKADALKTGAVLVDLPGAHDSNAARANVAKQYLQNCHAVWILAPITRAVDDKTAKDLLGETFKRQLLMDGQYSDSAVSFICSKTDDILCSEIIRTLELEEQTDPIEAEIATLQTEKSRLEAEIEQIKEDLEDLEEAITAAQAEADQWLRRHDAKARSWLSMSGSPSPTKRKFGDAQSGSSAKKARGQDGPVAVEEQDNVTVEALVENVEFTEAELLDRFRECGDRFQELAKEKEGKKRRKDDVKRRGQHIIDRLETLEQRRRRLCARKRNEWAKDVIQQDFREGLKELDDEDADQKDGANWDPNIPQRDYDSIKVKVFTVSARDYLKLTDKLKGDNNGKTFHKVEDTEIPKLQDHARYLTIGSRLKSGENFLTGVKHFVENIRTFLEDDGTLDVEDRQSTKDAFLKCLRNLDTSMQKACVVGSSAFQTSLQNGVFAKLQKGAQDGSADAISTTERWGFKPNKQNPQLGGYHWNTYKAACVRHGDYQKEKQIDMNDQLVRPMQTAITSKWERTFSVDSDSYLLRVLKQFEDLLSGALDEFFKETSEKLPMVGERVAKISQQQTDHVGAEVGLMLTDVRVRICEQQKEISRMLKPEVQKGMIPAYDLCAATSGKGTFDRMKEQMNHHITEERDHIFGDAARTVQSELNALITLLASQFGIVSSKVLKDLEAAYATIWEDAGQTKTNNTAARKMLIKEVIGWEQVVGELLMVVEECVLVGLNFS